MEKKVEEEETQVINLCDSQKHCTLDFMWYFKFLA
jgi:hypothetical protein